MTIDHQFSIESRRMILSNLVAAFQAIGFGAEFTNDTLTITDRDSGNQHAVTVEEFNAVLVDRLYEDCLSLFLLRNTGSK
jgi:hypothetical protein